MSNKTRGLVVALLALALSLGGLTLNTSAPLLASTETITVPNVQTGEPMELEVEKEAVSEADAAAYATLDCRLRHTTGGLYLPPNSSWRGMSCGARVGSGGNSVLNVQDTMGPICVYYVSTLAGCAGKGQSAYVGNRTGYAATVRTQPVRS